MGCFSSCGVPEPKPGAGREVLGLRRLAWGSVRWGLSWAVLGDGERENCSCSSTSYLPTRGPLTAPTIWKADTKDQPSPRLTQSSEGGAGDAASSWQTLGREIGGRRKNGWGGRSNVSQNSVVRVCGKSNQPEFPLFYFLFNHLFISDWTHRYLMYSLGYGIIPS